MGVYNELEISKTCLLTRTICRSIHAPPGEAVDVEGGGAGEEEKEKGLNLNSIVERAEVMFLMQKVLSEMGVAPKSINGIDG